MKFVTKSFLLLFPDLLFSLTLIEGPYYIASNWSDVFKMTVIRLLPISLEPYCISKPGPSMNNFQPVLVPNRPPFMCERITGSFKEVLSAIDRIANISRYKINFILRDGQPAGSI